MKKVIIIPFLLPIAFTLLVVINMIRFQYPFFVALERSIYFYSQTKWSEDFSESSFSKIKFGMSEYEVELIMKKPLWKSCNRETCIWAYATGTDFNVDFDRRYVYFNSNGKVSYIQKDYYAD